MGKKGLPEITDRFTDKVKRDIKAWELEGKAPQKTILCMENGYKINVQGQVIGQKNIQLKPIFRKWKKSPIVIMTINKKDSNGNIITQTKEERIDNLMEKYFWSHIEWYWEKIPVFW